MARQQQPDPMPCPCGGHGRHLAYAKCCQPYLEGGEAGRGHRMTERSSFIFEDGRWFYVDGVVEAS